MATESARSSALVEQGGQPTSDASKPVVNQLLVAAALGRLSPEHRNVLRECCFRGRSVAQAAHALGITPGTVQSRIYYALRALRLALEELGGVEAGPPQIADLGSRREGRAR